jgi:hypothetical protein
VIDMLTNKPLRVLTHELTPPDIRVALDQLPAVQAVLDTHKVRYWVDHQAVSVDGSPFVIVINLRHGTDPKAVQEILDRAACLGWSRRRP